jgi:hypothetical protein
LNHVLAGRIFADMSLARPRGVLLGWAMME